MIFGSVGQGGTNYKLDTYLVQSLLNYHMRKSTGAPTTIAVDGLVGSKTKDRIGWFQTSHAGFSYPDKRVDPGGKTWTALLKPPKAKSGGSTAPPPKPDTVTEEEIKVQIDGMIAKFGFDQKQASFLEEMFDDWTRYYGSARTVAVLADSLLVQSTLISSAGAVGATIAYTAGALQLFLPFAMWYGFYRQIDRVYGNAYMSYAARARAYTLTAIAFGQARPTQSKTIIDAAPISTLNVPRMHRVWKETATEAKAKFANMVMEKFSKDTSVEYKLIERAYCTALRTSAKGSKTRLAKELMKQQESLFDDSPVAKSMYKDSYNSILYPR